MTFFEWLGRVIMLMLAGMITLSIIGAIAAIPSGSLPERIAVAERQPVSPPPEPQPTQPQPASEPRPTPEEARPRAPAAKQVAAAPAPPLKPAPAEWLEAITYALLALVGIAALATLILWRILHQRRRIADALEAISRAGLPASSSPPNRA